MLEETVIRIPSPAENPDGFHRRYHVTKADGSPADPDAIYLVLRLDDGCKDKEHLRMCRSAARSYASYGPRHLDGMCFELAELLDRLDPPVQHHPENHSHEIATLEDCLILGFTVANDGTVFHPNEPGMMVEETPRGLVLKYRQWDEGPEPIYLHHRRPNVGDVDDWDDRVSDVVEMS